MAVSADLYRTFLGVGLYLSFSRAAKELGVSLSLIHIYMLGKPRVI